MKERSSPKFDRVITVEEKEVTPKAGEREWQNKV